MLEGNNKEILKAEILKNKDKEEFIKKCENVMNKSTIYDRKLFKEAFKNIYNDKENKYNFPINNNFLSNIITRWKNNSYRFKKESVI